MTDTAVTPRIAPGDRKDTGLIGWTICQVAGRANGTGPPNLLTTMARQRPLFRNWLRFASRLMPAGRLPRRETELVILRVAHLRTCNYEFDSHVHLAAKAGVDDQAIRRVVDGPDAPGWSRRDVAVLTAVDELIEQGDLADETWEALRTCLTEREAIELVLLVGHYEMLATFITTLRIQPDPHR